MKQGIRNWHFSDAALFAAYLLWIGIGLAAAALRIGPDAVAAWNLPGSLAAFVDGCLRWGDPVLIVLAALNTHWMLARIWGPRAARRWLLAVVALSAAVETVGTLTGFPFGRYAYTANFGPQLGPLPVTIPLAWYVLLSNALILWRSVLPGFVPSLEALAAAALVTGLDFLMEPFAARIRLYWFWSDPHGAVPWQNYAAWAAISFVLIRLFAKSPAHQDGFEPRPAAILGTMAGLFVIGRWTAGI